VSKTKTNPGKHTPEAFDVVLQTTEPSNDRGDETQRAFRYQNAYGVILLAAGLSGQTEMIAIWCEHHEDLLVELVGGRLFACQVKTKSSGNWQTTDKEFVNSLRRFAELEAIHGPHIDRYVFVSNCRPYVATKSAKNLEKIRKSPLKLAETVKGAVTLKNIPSPFGKSFYELVNFGINDTFLFEVLKKLDFIQGPSREDFEDTLVARHLPLIPSCEKLTVSDLAAIRDELIQKVWEASSLVIEGPVKHLDIIGPDGKPLSEKKAKRVTLEDVRFIILERSSYVFRYSPDVLEVNYGSGKSKMAVLRLKMESGGIAQHYPYIEAKAIAAEERLMAQGFAKPEETLVTVGHLEKVVLSECHEANMEAGLEPEEKRGIIMLNGMVKRLQELSNNEPVKVEGQPYEVLVGLAGLLSGECKVWWGIPLSTDNNHES